MSDEIKVIYLKTKTLTADVFQPDGSDRQTGISLTENSTGGLYLGDCSTIIAGDTIIAYEGTTLIGGGTYKQEVQGISGASGIDAAGYVGDYKVNELVHFLWRTAIAASTAGTIKVYKDDGTSEVTIPTGITDTRDFDSKTGVHLCTINLPANSFYAKERDYLVVLSGAVIDGSTANAVIATFSIEQRYTGKEFLKNG